MQNLKRHTNNKLDTFLLENGEKYKIKTLFDSDKERTFFPKISKN